MAIGRKIYIDEWLAFRGQNQIWLAKVSGVHKGLISKLARQDFSRSPRPKTIDKLTTALNIGREQIWMDPFVIATKESRHEPYDLQSWLDDPLATIEGRLATQKEKENLQKLFDFIVERKESADE